MASDFRSSASSILNKNGTRLRPVTVPGSYDAESYSPSDKKLPNIPGLQRNPVSPQRLQQSLGYTQQGYMIVDDPAKTLKKVMKTTAKLGHLKGSQSLSSLSRYESRDTFRPATGPNFAATGPSLEKWKEVDDLRSTAPSLTSSFYSSVRTSWEPAKEADNYYDLDGRYSITQQRKDRQQPICQKTAPLRDLPKYVVHDRQVLCFFGYYVEPIENSALETNRVRRVTLQYYPEDQTIDVHEGRQSNSGLPQGVLIRRHKVTKPRKNPAFPEEYFTIDDLGVGRTLDIYSKVFTLVDCDDSTRSYLSEIRGQDEPPPFEYPPDSYGAFQAAKTLRESGANQDVSRNRRMHPMKYFMEARLGKPANRYDVPQFLENDGKVLRFDAIWDDTARLYGDVLPFTVLYYLADDTIEVLQVKENNNGRAPFPKLLKRMRLVRRENDKRVMQYDEDFYSKDHAAAGRFYHWTDLTVGSLMTVYNRDLLLIDADNSTREHYQQNGMSLGPKYVPAHQSSVKVPIQTPAYNGWGSEEDSLRNCELRVGQMQHPKLDPPVEEDQVVLRFSAKMRTDVTVDKTREFVVLVYMSDGAVAVHEPPVVNSGIMTGTFLKRMRVKKSQAEDFYAPRDFYVGASIQLNAHKFDLYDADEYTLKYMEQYSRKFPKSDITVIGQKIRPMKGQLESKLASFRNSVLTERDLQDALNAARIRLTKHEVTTLARASALDGRKPNGGALSYEKLMQLF